MAKNIHTRAGQLIENPIQFKIAMAKYFLSKMSDRTPKNTLEQIRLEANAEMFLFFASSVVELLKRRINDKFEIFDAQNVFYIHGLRKNLANNGIQKKTKQEIARYFSAPIHIGSKIDATKSTLWRMQALRNQAMHGNVVAICNHYAVFSYTVRNGKKSYSFVQKTQSPSRYFGQIFSNLERFNAKISEILG